MTARQRPRRVRPQEPPPIQVRRRSLSEIRDGVQMAFLIEIFRAAAMERPETTMQEIFEMVDNSNLEDSLDSLTLRELGAALAGASDPDRNY